MVLKVPQSQPVCGCTFCVGSVLLPGEACHSSSPTCVSTPTASPRFTLTFPGALRWVPLHFSVFKTQSPASSVMFPWTTPTHGRHLPFLHRARESLPGSGTQHGAVCPGGPSPWQATCLWAAHPCSWRCRLPLHSGCASGLFLTRLPASRHPDEREVDRFFQGLATSPCTMWLQTSPTAPLGLSLHHTKWVVKITLPVSKATMIIWGRGGVGESFGKRQRAMPAWVSNGLVARPPITVT